MEKKNKLIIAVAIIGLILIMGGGTYAFFTANTSGNETGSTLTVQGGTLEIEYANQSNIITLNNIYPRGTEWVTKNFTVTGTNTIDTTMNYRVGIEVLASGFADGDLTYTLTNTDAVTPTGNPITSASGDVLKTETTWIGYGQFAASSRNVVHTYQLKIYYLSTNESQNNKQGVTFRAKVVLVEAGIGALPAEPEYIYTNYNTDQGYAVNGDEFQREYMVPNYSTLNAALAESYRPIDYWDENSETMLVPIVFQHTLLNNIVTDSSLIIIINNEFKSGAAKYWATSNCEINELTNEYDAECLSQSPYNNLTNGTYYLSTNPVMDETPYPDLEVFCKNEYLDDTYGCLDPNYSTNVSTLQSIFGVSNCSESTNDYYYKPEYTQKNYTCGFEGFEVSVSSLGQVFPYPMAGCFELNEFGVATSDCN